MNCEHCNNAEATETIKIQRRGNDEYITLHLCEACIKKISEGELPVPIMEGRADVAITVAISKTDTHMRIEIKAPLRPEAGVLSDEEFASALLGFVAQQIAEEAADKRGKNH